MGSARRAASTLAFVAVVACASPLPRTGPQHATDPCRGRPTTNVGARLAAGELLSALRVSEWACVDEETREGLAAARAWLAEPCDPDASLAEAQAARARGDHVLARRLFDRAALGMQRVGSPPRWELPGPVAVGGDAIFVGSTRVASVAGTRVVLTDVATGARRLLWPRAGSAIVRLAASDDARLLAAEASDEVLVWDGPDFAGRVRVKDAFDYYGRPSLQFARNGLTLVVADREGVKLWDTTTHQTIAVVPGSEFLFVKDRLVVDGMVVVEPTTGDVVAKLPRYTGSPYWSMGASPDGRILLRQWCENAGSAQYSRDRYGVEVWDTSTWRRLGGFDTGPAGITGAPVFSRDGTRLFAPIATWLGVFDLQRRRLEVAWNTWFMTNAPWHPVSDPGALKNPILEGTEGVLGGIELLADEKRVFACHEFGCVIFDWRTGRHETAGKDAQVLPDGSVISRSAESGSGERPGSFDVLDGNFETHRLGLVHGAVELIPSSVAEWERSSKPFVPLEPCGSHGTLRVSADGTAVLKADKPGQPCVWGRDDGQLRPRPPELPDFVPVTALNFSGTRLLLVGAAGLVRVLDLETGELSQAREADLSRVRACGSFHARVSTAAWPNGTASLNADLLEMDGGVLVREPTGGAFVVDAMTGVKLWVLDAEKLDRRYPVALAPGWVALGTGKYLDVWDAVSHERRQRLDCRTIVDGIAIDASAGQVAASCHDRGIFVWELATGTVLRKLDPPDSRVGPLALGGGWIVAIVGKDLVAWQGRAPAVPTWRWPLSGRPVFSVATDGHVVAVAHGAGGVSLYSLADGRERPTTVRLWNASAPEAVLEAPDGAIWNAAGGLLSMSRCMRGEQEVPTELCESIWVQDDLWRR